MINYSKFVFGLSTRLSSRLWFSTLPLTAHSWYLTPSKRLHNFLYTKGYFCASNWYNWHACIWILLLFYGWEKEKYKIFFHQISNMYMFCFSNLCDGRWKTWVVAVLPASVDRSTKDRTECILKKQELETESKSAKQKAWSKLLMTKPI